MKKNLLIFLSSLIVLSSIPIIVLGVTPNMDSIIGEDDEGETTVITTTETTTESTTQSVTQSTTDNTTISATTESTTRRVFLGEINVTTSSDASTTTQQSTQTTTLSSQETTTAHTHNYKIIDFSGETGVGTIRCELCGDIYTDTFVNHLFSDTHQTLLPDDEPWDVVPDGTINSKDYAALFKQFYSYYAFIADFLSSKQFLYKEMFAYIYLTVLFISCTAVICISCWRSKK